jgi:ankyrin repeat protein
VVMKTDGEELLEAVRQRKRGVAKSLIHAKANLNFTNSFGWTSLHWAADRGLLEVTNLLIDFQADVNARDLNEATPLIAATRANCLATARALLGRGAQLDLKDEWEDDALSVALSSGHSIG